MAKVDMERVREYLIPMNFIDESRFLNGMVKTRNFVEGSIMGGIIALIVWGLISAPFEAKISLTIGLAFPFFMLGLSGINGDAFSTFVYHAVSWARARGTMLYNNETRALAQAPIQSMLEEEGLNDKILNIIDSFKDKAQKKRMSSPLVEGRDFVFARDTDLEGNYLDEQQDAQQGSPVSAPQSTEKIHEDIVVVDAQEVHVSIETVSLSSNIDLPLDTEAVDLFSKPAEQKEVSDEAKKEGTPESLASYPEREIGEDGELF